jgi:hypothetical protein
MIPKSSSYAPKFRKRKMRWENTLFMGIEIELEHKNPQNVRQRNKDLGRINSQIEKQNYSHPFYYKTDSSLKNGVEFVAQPMTLQYMHNRLKTHHFFETIKKFGFSAQPTCGLHVHLSKEFFIPLELIKLRIFFSVNARQLSKFSRRDNENLTRWAKLEDYDIKDFLTGKKRDCGAVVNRSHACTFYTNNRSISNSKNTIELRLFSSTTSHKRFLAITQFCDAVGYFLKEVSILTVSKKTCWKEFVCWCEQKNRYQHLIEELENVHLAS